MTALLRDFDVSIRGIDSKARISSAAQSCIHTCIVDLMPRQQVEQLQQVSYRVSDCTALHYAVLSAHRMFA